MVKNPPANAGDMGLIPGLGRCPGGGHGESHGQRSPVGYSSWGCIESDMTEYAGAYCLTTSLASIIMVTVDISNRFQTLIKIAVMI